MSHSSCNLRAQQLSSSVSRCAVRCARHERTRARAERVPYVVGEVGGGAGGCMVHVRVVCELLGRWTCGIVNALSAPCMCAVSSLATICALHVEPVSRPRGGTRLSAVASRTDTFFLGPAPIRTSLRFCAPKWGTCEITFSVAHHRHRRRLKPWTLAACVVQATRCTRGSRTARSQPLQRLQSAIGTIALAHAQKQRAERPRVTHANGASCPLFCT